MGGGWLHLWTQVPVGQTLTPTQDLAGTLQAYQARGVTRTV